MRILGLSGGLDKIWDDEPSNFNWSKVRENAAAVLVEDGRVRFAIEEERLNRIPGTNKRPVLAIQKCLNEASLTLADIDGVAVYGEEKFYNHLIQKSYLHDPNHYPLYGTMRQLIQQYLKEECGYEIHESAIFFVKHQYSHAMSAWACSGYKRALVLSLDKAEDGFSGLVAKGSEGKLERLHTFHDVDSMVGLCHQVGEIMSPPIGSLTELSHIAMKGRAAPYRAFFQACYELLPNGTYKLRFDPNGLIEGLRLEGHSGAIEQRCNLAAALQEVLEAIVFHIVRHFQEETGMDTLCVGGELAGNVSLNSKLLDSGLFTAVFVQPIKHDAGAALGAALAQFSMENSEEKARSEMEHVYWGTAIETQDQIKEQAAHWSEWTAVKQELGMSIVEQVADLLSQRHSVGWMQERSEFGTCSLGNRSILLHPYEAFNTSNELYKNWTKAGNTYSLIVSIKESRLKDYFDVPATATASQYRFGNYLLKWKSGNDYMDTATYAQVHTVSENGNSRFYQLLDCFECKSGIPFLIHTSLRNPVEPIVETLSEGIAAFLSCKLEYLAVGDTLLSRCEAKQQDQSLLSLRLSVPYNVNIVEQISYQSTHRMEHSKELICAHMAERKVGLSTSLHALLMLADGRRSLGELMEEIRMADHEHLQIIQSVKELWEKRLVILEPLHSVGQIQS
ncbi:hypothetical protein BS614_20715 [Paenibacillus xylanexedens]|uniref:carbamoyltransferase N-terminal domain-containing protein n=1 Tax=Paenibacillus xylanexedens TaxID=528191 RepID=UPI00093870B9|nr:carbamoyltransferase N-terminal domain-containing protein [Paenibacillus xylanexedens]APO46206.1 hypothetical protein BS614_20715 [Paenibacillus xylanexedens]